MAEFVFTRDIAAPPECVYDLWVNLERMDEWIEGQSRVTDLVGTPGQTGTHYTLEFGRFRGRVEVIEGRRPSRYAWKIAMGPLAADFAADFTRTPAGTRLRQTLKTQGILAWIWARILATGSYRGSFRGEMATFARIAESEC